MKLSFIIIIQNPAMAFRSPGNYHFKAMKLKKKYGQGQVTESGRKFEYYTQYMFYRLTKVHAITASSVIVSLWLHFGLKI